ncbi:bifunctional 4-hydroxy-2-oxoglutarate aldolase/2-dehydro-3-deoxy-phosphogluconate aldolase [Marinobacter bryozoorum]|uniref:bifunctional 4-hydroxy-2-oxoglutarate aldolase/2-dehydro-3-deoxy-phosphogluconate aldolase n=1 Tax=Marinobacter bryozoorum TaxID=256324 RepID=UPI00200690E1|nr:bifunctional 4-hydroxy-2-oxoglutarate aldolase/2-dehydro-3-deoxy-phosphogluconate aldolase [Marinobacter bryozoorum]MCK7543253.1 bifunctional 4-hydroxy-2-oxoglutarate aldolase/2-dehydro-3-deoxy-phosphogluconate aldolase [Marinobacter bryozoorum]
MTGLSDQQRQRIMAVLEAGPLIPVISLQREADAVPLAEALVGAGIRVLEITLRTPRALPAIELLSKRLPDDVLVGAGTVTDPAGYRRAENAGARFVVSPGITPRLLDYGLTANAPLLPGVATVSELMLGYELGYRSFKFFPAEVSGGVKALEAFAGPFPDVAFCPTGGIRQNTARDYLALSNVKAVGGTWLTPESKVSVGDWAGVSRLARESLASCRGQYGDP